jgi:hypothetical protein
MRSHFSERELVDLTMAVVAINGWNRLMVSFRARAGDYVPGSGGRIVDAVSGSQQALD